MFRIDISYIQNSPQSGNKFTNDDNNTTPSKLLSFRFLVPTPCIEEPVAYQEYWSNKNKVNYRKIPIPILVEPDKKHIVDLVYSQ